MSNLSLRLSELMSEQDLNAKKLADLLNVHTASIYRFLSSKRMPNYDCFIKMLYVFNCSADYLLGLQELPTEEPLHPAIPFNERLRTLLKERNITQIQLIEELHLSSSILYNWLTGICAPSLDNLIRLAKYFECSVDFLIGRVR